MAKRAVVGWILLGLAAAILFSNLFQSPVGKSGCVAGVLALVGLVLAGGTGRGSANPG